MLEEAGDPTGPFLTHVVFLQTEHFTPTSTGSSSPVLLVPQIDSQ